MLVLLHPFVQMEQGAGNSQVAGNSQGAGITQAAESTQVPANPHNIEAALPPLSPNKRRKTNANGSRRTSSVWLHFNELTDVDEPIAACKHCHKRYRCDPSVWCQLRKAVTLMWKIDELICDISLYQSSNNIHFSVVSISCLQLYCFKVKIHLFVNLDEFSPQNRRRSSKIDSDMVFADSDNSQNRRRLLFMNLRKNFQASIKQHSVTPISMATTPPHYTQLGGATDSTHPPKSTITRKKNSNELAFKEKKDGFVDYDRGQHEVSTRIAGLRKEDIPARYRLRVAGNRFQKDWTVSEVVDSVLSLTLRDDVEGLLNRWIGRFARKNFPFLIRELTQRGSIEHCNLVFSWMKEQKNYCARTDIYNMMIRLHARHNRTDQARGLFFEMQKYRCKPDAETYNALINAHGRARQWRWAMNIMEDMLRAAIPPSRSTYNNLINACGSSGNWKEALNICKKMTDNGVGPDLVTHNIMLSAFKSGAQYSKALSYFELMKGTHIRPDTTTLSIIIDCLVKLKQYDKAIDIFNSMREKKSECHPDVVTFTSIIKLYSVSGQIENCEAAFNMMLAEGLKPSIVSYNALLGAYAARGMENEALRVFNEITQNGFRRDIVSYTSLLNAYGRSRKPQKAREIFKIIKRNNLKPNIITYNALIDAYGSNGLLEEAIGILREMEQDKIHPNVVSICTLLAACGRCCQKVKIDTVLSAAEMRGIKLNTAAYNSAIGSYINVREYDKAVDLYKTMREKKIRSDSVTYTVLISGCCKMSKFGEALSFMEEMMHLKLPMSKEVYSSVISAYSKQGQITEAESTFNLMKSSGCSPDVVTYTAMLDAYNTAEKWEKAYALFEEMEANDIKLDTIACAALMRAFNKGGQPGRVFSLAQSMREKDIPLSDTIFFEMVSACSLLHDWKTAVDVIKYMEPSLHVISSGCLNLFLNSLGKSGKIETMLKLFFKMSESGADVNINTYSILLKNLLSSGNWRKYLEVLQWMEDAGIHPSYEMYHDISSFSEKCCGAENAAVIKERLESLKRKAEDQISPSQPCESHV